MLQQQGIPCLTGKTPRFHQQLSWQVHHRFVSKLVKTLRQPIEAHCTFGVANSAFALICILL
jgi:hypothetical protein